MHLTLLLSALVCIVAGMIIIYNGTGIEKPIHQIRAHGKLSPKGRQGIILIAIGTFLMFIASLTQYIKK